MSTKVHYAGPITLDDVSDEEAPKRGADKEGADLTPFLALVTTSNDKRLSEHPKPSVGVTVLAASRQLIETRVRQAATSLGLGVSVVHVLHDSERGKALGLGEAQSRIVVTAKERKKSSKASATPSTAVTSVPAIVEGGGVVPAGDPNKGVRKGARI